MAKYTKKDWKPEYQKILVYAEQGMQQKDIAEKLGMTPEHICRVMKRETFIAKKSEFEEKVIDRARMVFENAAEEAAKRIVDIARRGSSEDRIRFDASKEVLYQVGMKPKEVIETHNREYPPEELESMKKTALEVEAIAQRLGSGDSKFVLTDEAEVTRTDVEPRTEPSSTDRPETL